MIKKGKELEFISQIKRDGSGTEKVRKQLIKLMQEDEFKINHLSLGEETFVASGFNTFVVRIARR